MADDSGVAAIEYALLASLLSIAGIAWLDAFAWSLSAMFDAVSTELSDAAQTIAGDPPAAPLADPPPDHDD